MIAISLAVFLVFGYSDGASSGSVASNSGIVGSMKRTCHFNDYFCAETNACYPRTSRCTNRTCDIGCFKSHRHPMTSEYSFKILMKYESLPGFWGSIVSKLDDYIFGVSKRRRRKRRVHRFKHVFVRYRGFIYEYGQDYPAGEVDPLDPLGPYNYLENPNGLNNYRVMGTSSCYRKHVLQYNQWWNAAFTQYHFTAINCQEYAHVLLKLLSTNCSQFKTRGVEGDVISNQYFRSLFTSERVYSECDKTDDWSWSACIAHIWSSLVMPTVFNETNTEGL